MAALFPTPAADENVIRYELYFARHEDAAAATLHASRDDEERAFVQRECAEMLAFAHARTRDFIWQRHRFHLQTSQLGPPGAVGGDLMRYYLTGETSVGDEIQDEWVVTWLLCAITTRYPNVVARMQDTDGEFLLIECADVLPEWVHPENSDGRVLVKGGVLHIVSPAIVSEEQQQSHGRRRHKKTTSGGGEALWRQRCIHAVLRDPASTQASDAVQRALSAKLSDVPRYMKENRHRIRCVLPVNAARILRRMPEILGAAVEAFYYREPKHATSICSKMEVFLPRAQSEEAEVSQRMVTFSRCMFAQLKQQQFFPPKPFQSHAQYSALAGASGELENRDDVASALAAEIGMKLTCGLEILYATSVEDQFGKIWRHAIDEALLADECPDHGDEEALGANDDDSWLYVHPDSLEEKLKQVEASMSMADGAGQRAENDAEGGAEELENIATMFNSFLGGISGIDGVEGNEPIQFDMSAFMEILNGDGGPQREPRFSEGGNYFYEDDEDDDDYLGHSSDGDSDDDDEDEDEARMEVAMAEMDAELSTSKMAKSFVRLEEVGGSAAKDEELDEDLDAADTPLDLDFNLLSNLLESFASQDGHAGPVSNILNEMSFPRRG